ncbi:hypothetical protein RRG08_045121 [Elysia crispata]|uniref:Uncharacterized protein n=1 Tax=Elysia crispata TaxID=231223 RepID=A0AAE0YSU5_9GAST|nr:hypothetical protein RRG08_045121 [Elysia crispata]
MNGTQRFSSRLYEGPRGRWKVIIQRLGVLPQRFVPLKHSAAGCVVIPAAAGLLIKDGLVYVHGRRAFPSSGSALRFRGLWMSESLDNRLQEHDAATISDKRVSGLGLVLIWWKNSRVLTDPGYLQGSLHQDREALHCLVSLRLLLFFQPLLVPLFESW